MEDIQITSATTAIVNPKKVNAIFRYKRGVREPEENFQVKRMILRKKMKRVKKQTLMRA
jgi:hypothetical protein